MLSSTEIPRIVRAFERLLKDESSGTPRVRHAGRRVAYVAQPGSASKKRQGLTPRAKQVFGYLARHRRATAVALQKALRVNRNVIAGAVHELKQVGFVRSEALAGGAFQSASEYVRSRRRKARR